MSGEPSFRKVFGVLLTLLFLGNGVVLAQSDREWFVEHNGRQEKVLYHLYTPPAQPGEVFPVLVCIHGLPIIDGQYVHSTTQTCTDEQWQKFAQENRVAILGLGFLFVAEDWPTKESYQYPSVWSGKALLEILDVLASEAPLNTKELYFFGISAGAQYAVRFAQWRPELVRALTAHAAGGYDWPQRYIPTKILLTVGEKDNKDVTRLEMAKYFKAYAARKGMEVELRVIPNIGHQQTEAQNERSRQFLRNYWRWVKMAGNQKSWPEKKPEAK